MKKAHRENYKSNGQGTGNKYVTLHTSLITLHTSLKSLKSITLYYV